MLSGTCLWWEGHRQNADVQTAGCGVQHHPSSPAAQPRSPLSQWGGAHGESLRGGSEQAHYLPTRCPTRPRRRAASGAVYRLAGLTRLHGGDAVNPRAEGQDKPRYGVLSEQLAALRLPMDKRYFLWPSSLAGPLCQSPCSYTACSSGPLAGWLAKPRRFWQRDVQHDRQRLPLSLAGCFPEFLLQGNVFILWNSCSLKTKTEQEHKSSVCPLGPLHAISKQEVRAVFSRITCNEQCCYTPTLAEESKALQFTNDTLLFFISPQKKSTKTLPYLSNATCDIKYPNLELCWGVPTTTPKARQPGHSTGTTAASPRHARLRPPSLSPPNSSTNSQKYS